MAIAEQAAVAILLSEQDYSIRNYTRNVNLLIYYMKEVFRLKKFMEIFLFCIVFVWIFGFFFLGLIVENTLALIIFIAFILAVFITIFVKQESRIEKLEKKMEELLSNRQE